MTPIVKPTVTNCIAISLPMPKSPHANGTRRSDPPATPDAPHAPRAEMKHRRSASPNVTVIDGVEFTAVSARMLMVTAAPPMFMVAPSGIEIE